MTTGLEFPPCPGCGTEIPPERWNSELPYCDCGWTGAARRGSVRVGRRAKMLVIGSSAAAALLAAFYGYGRTLYGANAPEALWLGAKFALKRSSEAEESRLAKICNAYRRYGCSKRVYRRIYRRDPENASALANLALAHTKSGDHPAAVGLYAGFFREGYHSREAALGYGAGLEALGRHEEAFDVYFKLALASPDAAESYPAIVRTLERAGRPWEALAALDVLLSNDRRLDSLISPARQEAERRLAEEKAPAGTVLRSAAIEGDGRRYVPVKVFQGAHYSSYAADPDARFLTLSRTEAEGCGIAIGAGERRVKLKTDFGRIYGHLVTIPHLHVGPWRFEEVPALVYDHAPLLFGRNALDLLEAAPIEAGGKEFLTLKKR